MEPVNSSTASLSGANLRLRLSLGLTAAIWITGLIGHFTPVREWPALALYVIGGIGLVLYRGFSRGEWQEMYLSGGDVKKSLKWGAIAGGILFVMDITNTVLYYTNGGVPMAEMEILLVGNSLLYLFPVLILAEEFLWRGIMLSSMIDRGLNRHLAVVLTALLYVFNHFAVAPVGMYERSLMAMMAFPIGILGGYIVISSRNVWGSVLLHSLTMISMLLDIFVIPRIIFG
ncbi:CPBP family intramembrane metalloprotease [Prosthecochloris sp. ZM_2]|uniref:CPBP family intramembrane glutamic endopeptidase n=1 Tax=Prosthecochloris sp. ZM_2 TaxID=2045206 RepID=UPI000DF84C2A|nr:CPBP family intramembrane glutamic endopeptidase [Prosthecochloris sp. ZM_2]RNA65290.1 CPBP family intramembrane metalloprotease [Prosthecochloris sp. ZM_2]